MNFAFWVECTAVVDFTHVVQQQYMHTLWYMLHLGKNVHHKGYSQNDITFMVVLCIRIESMKRDSSKVENIL